MGLRCFKSYRDFLPYVDKLQRNIMITPFQRLLKFLILPAGLRPRTVISVMSG